MYHLRYCPAQFFSASRYIKAPTARRASGPSNYPRRESAIVSHVRGALKLELDPRPPHALLVPALTLVHVYVCALQGAEEIGEWEGRIERQVLIFAGKVVGREGQVCVSVCVWKKKRFCRGDFLGWSGIGEGGCIEDLGLVFFITGENEIYNWYRAIGKSGKMIAKAYTGFGHSPLFGNRPD